MLTVDELKAALPPHMRKSVSTQVLENINQTMASDEEGMERYKEDIISYGHILRDGKFKVEQYLNAVKFVGFKVQGLTNFECYQRTFQIRYAEHIEKGTKKADIEKYVSAYANSKLVMLILEQTLTPIHIVNNHILQKAINIQAQIMMDTEVSAKVRSDAANSLMTHLKAPETKKISLDIGIKQDSILDSLRAATEKLVAEQRLSIQAGSKNAMQVLEDTVLEASYEEIDE